MGSNLQPIGEEEVGERIDAEALRRQYAEEDALDRPAPEIPSLPPPIRLQLTPSGGYFSPDDPLEPGAMDYQAGEPRGSITDREGAILAALAYRRTVLEIGTGLGVSTGYLARHARRVDTIDPSVWVGQRVFPHLRLLGNVVCHEAMNQSIPRPVDLVFVDGCHLTEHVMADLGVALSIVKPEGLIVMHDWALTCVQLGCVGFDVIGMETECGLGLIIPKEATT